MLMIAIDIVLRSALRQERQNHEKQQIIVRTCRCTNAAENKVCQVQVTAYFSNA